MINKTKVFGVLVTLYASTAASWWVGENVGATCNAYNCLDVGTPAFSLLAVILGIAALYATMATLIGIAGATVFKFGSWLSK